MSTGDAHRRSEDPSPGRIAAMGTLGVVIGAFAMAAVGFAFTSAFDPSARAAAVAEATPSETLAAKPSSSTTVAPATNEASSTRPPEVAAATADPSSAPQAPPATTLTGSLSSLLPPTTPASSEKLDAPDPYATAQPSDAPLAKDVYDGI